MSLSTCNHCGGFIPLGPDASNKCEDCGKGVFSCPEPTPPPFCDTGTMFNQFLPPGVGFRVDPLLPLGTLEVWQDGKRIARIENIGSK